MAHEGPAVRAWSRVLVLTSLLASGCGGDDDSAASSPSTATSVARSADAVEAALLTAREIGEGWRTDGPEPLDMDGGAAPQGRCPDGDRFTLPASAMLIEFDADIDLYVSELLLTFTSPDDGDAWPDAFESCVGQSWEESDDPVEHVTVEGLEIADVGDGATAFRVLYAHGDDEEPAHDEGVALVRLDDVLVVVSTRDDELTEPYDRSLLDDVVAKAVAKAEATLGQ